MLDKSYLRMGLDGLSRAHGPNYFSDGHIGASVIAAYYLCHENGLDNRTQQVIKSLIDKEYGNDTLFRPAPKQTPDVVLLETFIEVLSTGIGDLREVGHNIIFGAAALKVFRELPNTITPFRVEGLCKLIKEFTVTQIVPLEDDDGVPSTNNENKLITFIFNEYLQSIAQYNGFGQGWTGHLLTIGHAVIELSRLGHPELTARAHEAFRQYISTIRHGPKDTDRRIPDHPASILTPLEYGYWKRTKSVRSGLGHSFKYPYSFYNLFSQLKDPVLRDRCLAESSKIF